MAEMRAISYSSVDAMIASVALPWCWRMGPIALRRTGKVLWRKREKEERGVVCAGRLIVRPVIGIQVTPPISLSLRA